MQSAIADWFEHPMPVKLGSAVLALTIMLLVMGWIRGMLVRRLTDNNTRYQARKAITIASYVLALGILAVVFSNQLGGLTVAFGVAGAGIAFALQEVIASIAGWVAVSFGGFYRVGDRVELGGIKGDVIDIGILRTTVMQMGEWVHADQYNGRIVRVANSFVFKEPVFNYSGEFPFLWDEIAVPVHLTSDVASARALIERVAKEVVGAYSDAAEEAWKPITRRYMIEKASVQPMVVMKFDANWIEFTLRYVVDYKARRITKDRLFERILLGIKATGGVVEVAGATLNIEKLAPLDVHLHRMPRTPVTHN
jgi:small-conductance mechanosensitive channel